MKYTLNKKTINIEEFKNVEVFGITFYKNDKIILNVEDISPNKEFVEDIINKLIKYDVSIYHIMDVIEDELFEHIG